MVDAQLNRAATDLAKRIAVLATPVQCEALLSWATELQLIRDSLDSPLRKAHRAVKATLKREVIAPVLQAIRNDTEGLAGKAKEVLWDDRGWPARLGMVGLTIGTLALSGKAAGLAVFGRAIAVPIWLVLTASGTFLGSIIEEVQKSATNKSHGNRENSSS